MHRISTRFYAVRPDVIWGQGFLPNRHMYCIALCNNFFKLTHPVEAVTWQVTCTRASRARSLQLYTKPLTVPPLNCRCHFVPTLPTIVQLGVCNYAPPTSLHVQKKKKKKQYISTSTAVITYTWGIWGRECGHLGDETVYTRDKDCPSYRAQKKKRRMSQRICYTDW